MLPCNVTRRRDAVYPATLVGIPPQEDAYIAKATEKIFLASIRLAVQPEDFLEIFYYIEQKSITWIILKHERL